MHGKRLLFAFGILQRSFRRIYASYCAEIRREGFFPNADLCLERRVFVRDFFRRVHRGNGDSLPPDSRSDENAGKHLERFGFVFADDLFWNPVFVSVQFHREFDALAWRQQNAALFFGRVVVPEHFAGFVFHPRLLDGRGGRGFGDRDFAGLAGLRDPCFFDEEIFDSENEPRRKSRREKTLL